jgi:ABC-type cobalamin/Fe3+-siderophores transport system ATPase subunit
MSWMVEIPTIDSASIALELFAGQPTYMVGPNGSGKSALLSFITGRLSHNVMRVAAHRQNYSNYDAPHYPPREYSNLVTTISNNDRQPQSRYQEHNSEGRLSQIMSSLMIVQAKWQECFVETNRLSAITIQEFEKSQPSPLQQLNDVLAIGAIELQISISPDQRISGQYQNSQPIGISRFSDGERNAVFLAAAVLGANSDSICIIDEPERHIHRAITVPLMRALFNARPDCAFVIATHEIALPVHSPGSQTIVLRGCRYVNGDFPSAFDLNVLQPKAALPDDLRRALLGSKRRILFVEGDADSLDSRIYSLLFPKVTVVPKGGCSDVMAAVRGLRGAEELH